MFVRRSICKGGYRSWGWVILLALMAGRLVAAPVTIYETGFEASEGYDPAFDLEGQEGWLGMSPNFEGDNGLLVGFFPGAGQQAYVGEVPELEGEEAVFVWQPLGEIPPGLAIVEFSVKMRILDSTEAYPNRDFFEWSAYDPDGTRFFTLGFDNEFQDLYYNLENGTNFVALDQVFSRDVTFQLKIRMDLGLNRWSAEVDGETIVSDLPITEFDTPLILGDVDAVWVYSDPEDPGDNLMVFDDYKITAEGPPAPSLSGLTPLPDGQVLMRVLGEAGRRYAVEASTDFLEWTSLGTNTADNGFFNFVDTAALSYLHRFYRARQVP